MAASTAAPACNPKSPWRITSSAVHATSSRNIENHHAGSPAASTQGRRFVNQRHEDDFGVELEDLPPGATTLVSRGVSSSSSTGVSTAATREDEEEEGVQRSGSRAGTEALAGSRLSSRCSFSSLSTGVAHRPGRGKALRSFWEEHVSLLVEQDSSRDHLALERTYLGYFRTSTLLATAGVFITQLYVVQEEPAEPVVITSSSTGSIRMVGRSLATALFALALGTVVCGTCRFVRFQRALVRGVALSGLWFELFFVLGGAGIMLVTMFVIVIMNKT